jgi:Protein of unknown function (DUF2909)
MYTGSMDLTRLLIVAALFAIIASLGSALFQLSRGQGDSRKMLRALTWRISLSVGLFLLLLLAWRLGYIQPHSLR